MAFSQEHPELTIRVVDNPKRIIPAAVNTGILASSGDILVRMDARELYHFSRLREDSHAQWAIRNLAADIAQVTSGRYYIGCFLQKVMEVESMWARFVAFKEA